jgi:hypothetical protein
MNYEPQTKRNLELTTVDECVSIFRAFILLFAS